MLLLPVRLKNMNRNQYFPQSERKAFVLTIPEALFYRSTLLIRFRIQASIKRQKKIMIKQTITGTLYNGSMVQAPTWPNSDNATICTIFIAMTIMQQARTELKYLNDLAATIQNTGMRIVRLYAIMLNIAMGNPCRQSNWEGITETIRSNWIELSAIRQQLYLTQAGIFSTKIAQGLSIVVLSKLLYNCAYNN